MIELLPLAETPVIGIDQLTTASDPLRTTFDGALSIGLVAGGYRIARRLGMAWALPENLSGFDPDDATADRSLRALAVLVVLYPLATALTTAAVYLGTTLALALAWAGVCTFVGAALALAAAKNASPLDDVRLLAAARAHADE